MKKVLLSIMIGAVALSASAQKAKIVAASNKATTAAKPAADATGSWMLDASHSGLNFSVSHLVISETSGKFKIFEGTVESKTADFQGASINFSADVNTINTDDEKRDQHLKSDDFFNAEKFPKMTFKSTSFKKVSGNKYVLVGDLTIRDITKKVTFAVSYGGIVVDPWKNTKAGFKLTGKISRKAFGLKWSTMLESGGAVVGDEVEITSNIELGKKV